MNLFFPLLFTPGAVPNIGWATCNPISGVAFPGERPSSDLGEHSRAGCWLAIPDLSWHFSWLAGCVGQKRPNTHESWEETVYLLAMCSAFCSAGLVCYVLGLV